MSCVILVKLFISIFLSCGCRHLILQKFCSAGAALSPGRHPPVRCLGSWTYPALEWLLLPVQSCPCPGSGGQTRRCSVVCRGRGQFPWRRCPPRSTGQIATASEPFPSTIPRGPAVRVLPTMRPCSTCLPSCRGSPPSSISVPVHDLSTHPTCHDCSQGASCSAWTPDQCTKDNSARLSFHLQ